METLELIRRLKACTGPDRALDGYIAMVLGFRKRIEPFTDASGRRLNRTIWLVPTGDDIARIPHYTGNLEEAFQLALAVAPNQVGGVSWVRGSGTATINDGGYHEGATPALALCVAALSEKLKSEED